MIREEKLMTKKLQDKFTRFVSTLSTTLSKPEQKFLKACCFGILSSRSCIVRRTAQSLNEKISSKKTQERMIYHLDKAELDEKISQTLLQKQCHKLKKHSLIIVDPSDIVKKYAKKMEGLSRVRDGNDGVWRTGYDALDIVGINTNDKEISILPIHSQLHSNTVEVDTMKNKLFDRIVDIIIHSNNRGTFVFDREFDDKKLIKELHQHAASYIIRMKKNRNVYLQNKKMNIATVAKATKLRYRFKPKKGVTISAGICTIDVPINPHTLKNPILVKTKLVVAKIRSKHKDGSYSSGMFYLLCHNSDESFLERDFVKFVLESYHLRWKIEEVHRQVKTDFGWEDIQLLTYRRLQTMNTLLWAALSFLYGLESWKYRLAKTFTNMMLERKNRLSELNKFVYYKLATVIRYCFNRISLYQKITFQNKKKEPLQLWIQGF